MKTLGSTYYIFPLMFTYKGWHVTVQKVHHYGIKRLKMKVVFELSAEGMAADYAIGRGSPETYLSSYRHCFELAKNFVHGRKKRIEKKIWVSSIVYGKWGYLVYFLFLKNVKEIYAQSQKELFSVANGTRQKAIAYIDNYLGDVQSQWLRFLKEYKTWD